MIFSCHMITETMTLIYGASRQLGSHLLLDASTVESAVITQVDCSTLSAHSSPGLKAVKSSLRWESSVATGLQSSSGQLLFP